MRKLLMLLTILSATAPVGTYAADLARDHTICVYGGAILQVGEGIKYCTHPDPFGGCLQYQCMVCHANGQVSPGNAPGCYTKKRE